MSVSCLENPGGRGAWWKMQAIKGRTEVSWKQQQQQNNIISPTTLHLPETEPVTMSLYQ